MIKQKSLERLEAMLAQARINSAQNTDDQALQASSLYPEWSDFAVGATLAAGIRVNFEGGLYNVLQTHQKQELWTPETAPSLFSKVLIQNPEVAPEWYQPDSTNGYKKGDRVTHNEKTWESLVDNNVWEPDAIGSEELWKEI